MKIGFIGTGNMATAIIKGVVDQKTMSPKNIFAYDVLADKLDFLAKEFGFQACRSGLEVIQNVDAIVLAVKPQILSGALSDLRDEIKNTKKLVISIAAGTTLEKLQKELGDETPIVRVMPNVNLMVGEGTAAVCGNAQATQEQIQFVLNIFQSAGTAIQLEEKDFSNFTAIAGSSPAYAYLFIDSIARAAVKHGLPKEVATKIAAQAVLGSAKMIKESKETPWELIDKVCSPGGTTVAGLLALEENRFIATVVSGIDATIKRDKEIEKENT